MIGNKRIVSKTLIMLPPLKLTGPYQLDIYFESNKDVVRALMHGTIFCSLKCLENQANKIFFLKLGATNSMCKSDNEAMKPINGDYFSV